MRDMLTRSLERMEQPPAPNGTSTTKKWLVGAFLALLAVSGGYYWGEHRWNTGFKDGLRALHQMCYEQKDGGMALDKETGRVIMCAPLTKLPKEELKRFNQEA